MTESGPSHREYLEVIGGTAATGRTPWERRWNQYYFRSCRRVVASLLADANRRGQTVLDVGTSHGNWLRFLRGRGFGRVLGVELDPHRAELARQAGYDEVFNCDAAGVPLPDASLDAAVSNDVFVHILRREDKAAVIREMARLLRAGGAFVFNQAMSPAFGLAGYQVVGHCSFMELHDLLALCLEARQPGGFRLVDLRPSYYTGAKTGRGRTRLRTLGLMLPLGVLWRCHRDLSRARWLGLERADSVYVKLVKG